jgi:hypothetical protein
VALRSDQLSTQRAAIAERIQGAASLNTKTEADLQQASVERQVPMEVAEANGADDDDDHEEDEEDGTDFLAKLVGITGKIKEKPASKSKAAAKAKGAVKSAPAASSAASKPRAAAVPAAPAATTRATHRSVSPPQTPSKGGRKALTGESFDPETYLDNDGMVPLRVSLQEIATLLEQDCITSCGEVLWGGTLVLLTPTSQTGGCCAPGPIPQRFGSVFDCRDVFGSTTIPIKLPFGECHWRFARSRVHLLLGSLLTARFRQRRVGRSF